MNMSRSNGWRWLGYAIGLAVYSFLAAPVVVVIASSFDPSATYFANFPPQEFGLRWYFEIPPKYMHALGVSMSAAGLAAIIAGVLGVLAALGIVRGNLPGAESFRSFFRAPIQIPFIVTGVVFLQFYYGLYAAVGLDLIGSLPGLVLAYVFIGTPYTVGTVGAMLERLNPRLEEAAAILGASRWSIFWRVTFPLIRPGVMAGMLFAFIIAFGDVPISIFLSSSSYSTLPVEIFQTLQFDFSPTVLAISTLIASVSVVALWLMQRLVSIDLVVRR